MTRFLLRDNSFYQLEHESPLLDKVCDKSLLDLEKEGVFVFPSRLKDAEFLDEEQVLLKSSREGLATGNIMGFLGHGTDILQINSRFSEGSNDYFFSYLLDSVIKMPSLMSLSSGISRETDFFNFLVLLFPSYIKQAFSKGPYKEYISYKRNDSEIKGALDIARHIRENTPFTGKISYKERNFAYDNPVLELIRHCSEFIVQLPFGKQLLSSVKDELSILKELTVSYRPQQLRQVIEYNRKHPVKQAYFSDYQRLQRLCILILSNRKDMRIDLGFDRQRIFGLLIDGAWLWEEYIHSLTRDIFFHPKNRAHEGKHFLFSRGRGPIYPDFMGKDGEKPFIADAKYKPQHNINRGDYLQILAYMFRFEAKQACFIYPSAGFEPDQNYQLLKGSRYWENATLQEEIVLKKLGLHIPQEVATFEDFKSQMQLSEEDFKARLKALSN